jgi:probable rRNA maturation factor
MGKGASPRIRVRNLQQVVPVEIGELEKFAKRAVCCCIKIRRKKRTELSGLGEVFVWLISDRRMSRLHRQFLGQTGPTDVLTFQHGEIFISVEVAKRQARVFGNSLMRELKLYIVHGLLHLHRFDDRTQSGAWRMKRMQEKILSDCRGTL